MFHETNSINTFDQPSCKMLNCSKHKNQIKICFHNWTQAFSPIISWQLYKSWWNTSVGKTELWLGHWGPGTNTSNRACGKGAQILQPVPTHLPHSPATHMLPTILYGVNTFAQTNGRCQEPSRWALWILQVWFLSPRLTSASQRLRERKQRSPLPQPTSLALWGALCLMYKGHLISTNQNTLQCLTDTHTWIISANDGPGKTCPIATKRPFATLGPPRIWQDKDVGKN